MICELLSTNTTLKRKKFLSLKNDYIFHNTKVASSGLNYEWINKLKNVYRMTNCLQNDKLFTELCYLVKFKIARLAHIHIQIRTIQLLIFTEKFSPLPEFEPGTSPVPSWYATNWAILAWIIWTNLCYSSVKYKIIIVLLGD